MTSHFARALLAGCAAIGGSLPAGAQQAPVEVTFEVPLNLTRLPVSIVEVRVSCTLHSLAILRSPADRISTAYTREVTADLPVQQGAVVQTAQLTITLDPAELDNPSGKQATYECELLGFDPTRRHWVPFSIGQGDLILTPTPAVQSGQFVW